MGEENKLGEKPKAITFSMVSKEESLTAVENSLAELERLLDTLGFEVVDQLIQHKDVPTARTMIGSGKVHELRILCSRSEIELAVFDGDLSATQARNLESALGKPVTDRCGIILDIFSQHAKTYEAKLQIELAQLEYGLSRLKRKWTHLSRQKGGLGLRGGEGETQLEVDRRMTRKSIQVVKDKLNKIQRQRNVQKKSRQRFFKVAIVGYTNSGKSTLMNRLCESEVLVQDKLFATLDPTTRIIKPEEKPAILFSDTVGFIKKLPHQLVASFRSTFEEIQDAHLLMHVVDISDPEYKRRIADTINVLEDLDLKKIPRMLVFNKIDANNFSTSLERKLIQSIYPQAVFVSARTGEDVLKLKDRIFDRFASQISEKTIEVSFGAEKLLEQIYELTKVMGSRYAEDRIYLCFRGATRDVNYLLDRLEKEQLLLQSYDGINTEIIEKL